MSWDYSLGYVRGFADTHGSLHNISKKHLNHRAITFKSMDETVLDELALHLDVLGYEYKRYVLAPGEDRQTQHVIRIHKQPEVRRFCEEVGFRRSDRARRANEFLSNSVSRRN